MKLPQSLFKRNRTRGRKAIVFPLILSCCAVLLSEKSTAQTISFTTLGTASTENFDALANSGTTNPLTINGWYMTESGGGSRDNEQYAADNGASNTGDTYSYGATGATERSLGGLRSGTLIPLFGAMFTNNTGATITSLDVAYMGEEWRCGTTGRTDQINFEYSLNATSLTTGTWTGVTALNFVTPVTTSTGAKDGNTAPNRTALSSTIASLSIANGATVWIRWSDVDATSSDDGLAVDDFSITPNGAALPPAPEIDVLGNSVSIVSGDVTPSAADFTDFGSQSVCNGTVTHTFTVKNTGTANLTLSGVPSVVISGTNASDFTTSGLPVTTLAAGASTSFSVTFDPSGSGLRTATISIANNDSDENPYTFAISGTGSNVSITTGTVTNVSCNGGNNGSATITASGGAPSYTYSWSPTGGTAATASSLSANTYVVTVTDANGCSQTQSVTITEPAALAATSSATNILCNGGTATVSVSATGGTMPYTGTGAFTTSAGAYSYTVTDSKGCTATASGTITEPTALAATSSATNILCNGGTSTITIGATGGTMPYAGTGMLTVNAGAYNYTVTDTNGCIANTSITVTEPTVLMAASSATAILCNGSTAMVTVSGNGGTTPYTGTGMFSVNAGNYTYVITDTNGCMDSTSIAVTQPTALTITSSATPILCNGGTSMVTVSGNGGTAPYTGTGMFSVSAGNYTYVVTDTNGCADTTSIAVTQPAVLTAASSATSIACNGGTAMATISATGGTTPYAGTGMLSVSAGTYNYTVTDTNGCVANTSITITEPAPLTASATSAGISCNGGTAIVNIAATGGISPYTGTGSVTVSAGSYNYMITDHNGCTQTTTISVTEPAPINVSTSTTGNTINATNTTATNYQWINCDLNTAVSGATSASYTASSNGSYAVIITDGGCMDTSACVLMTITGISESSLSADDVTIYPNPATAQITVQLANGAFTKGSLISIYDVTGKRVSATAVTSETTTIDLQELQKGIYFISLQNVNGMMMKKIIKE